MAFKEFFKIWCVNDSDKNDRYGRFLAGMHAFCRLVWNFFAKINILGNLLSGGLAGCVTFYFIYPLDFSRTRLAVDMGKGGFLKYFYDVLNNNYY